MVYDSTKKISSILVQLSFILGASTPSAYLRAQNEVAPTLETPNADSAQFEVPALSNSKSIYSHFNFNESIQEGSKNLKSKEKETTLSDQSSVDEDLIAKAKQRAAILENRAQLSKNPNIEKIKKNEVLNQKSTSKKSKLNLNSKSMILKNHDTPYETQKYYSWNYTFWSSNYVNNMNQLVTTLYAPNSNAYYMSVDFDSIDMEPGYDYVYLYDRYGLCAYYTGYYNEKLSATCSGNWVDVVVKTDSARSGYDGYSGFRIQGFYYSVDTYIPVAVAAANTYKTQINSTIYFDASYSYDFDNNIKEYRWNFGDGSYSYSKYPNHSYSRPGSYKVTLEVVDHDNNSSVDTFWMQIYDAPPKVILSLPKGAEVSAVNQVQLQITKSRDSGAISNASIDWGDGSSQVVGSISSSKVYKHIYSEPGDYLISVTVVNTVDLGDSYISLTITDTPVAPQLTLDSKSYNQITKNQFKTYKVSPTYLVTDDGMLESLTVNFGGATPTSTQSYNALNDGFMVKNFSYEYVDPSKAKKSYLAGMYNVTAEAVDNEGATANVQFSFVTKNQIPSFVKASFKKAELLCNNSTTCQVMINPKIFYGSDPLALFTDKDGQVVRYGWEFLYSDKKTVVSGCELSDTENSLAAQCQLPSSTTSYVARFKIIDNLGGVKKYDWVISKSKINPK